MCAASLKLAARHHGESAAALPSAPAARLRLLALEFGDTYSSYLATEPDREYFWSSEDAVLAFRRHGRFVVVADGLLAHGDRRPALLAEFLDFARRRRWHASFVNVPRSEVNLYRRLGCQVTKCGEEPFIRLQRTRFQGKNWEWARRQENFCRRHGVEFREVDPNPQDADYRDRVAPQLERISDDHIADTLHRRELQFFVSQFSTLDVRDRRLFVAEHGGVPQAFIVCNPGLAGDLWAVEVYRRRRDAVRGVIPALIMHALRAMQAEGVAYASLSLCPFLRCTPVVGDSGMYRYFVNFWWRWLGAIYDMPGLFHFKSRFHPEYREMFIAAHPCVTVRSMWAIARIWGLLQFNPLRLAARLLQRTAVAERRQLAMPHPSADRRIRALRARKPAAPPTAPVALIAAVAAATADVPPAAELPSA
jgi:phosphatidylglycerol lysyltransferase